MATIDPPRAIRIKTSTGWADLALAGAPGDPGYPPTTGKLSNVLTVTADGAAPTWQPTQPSGSTIAYVGEYDPARVYHDGDYVIGPDGVTYQCVVEGTTGIAPVPWTPAPAPPVAYGTSLPTSPLDGQEAILVDSVANPSYQWRFRYNAGSSSAYKWEYVGGAPAMLSGDPGTPPGGGAGTWGKGAAPTFTLPRAGDYSFAFTVWVTWNVSGSNLQASIWCNGGGGTGSAIVIDGATTTGSYATLSQTGCVGAGLPVNDSIGLAYYSGGQVPGWATAYLTITPRRVS